MKETLPEASVYYDFKPVTRKGWKMSGSHSCGVAEGWTGREQICKTVKLSCSCPAVVHRCYNICVRIGRMRKIICKLWSLSGKPMSVWVR